MHVVLVLAALLVLALAGCGGGGGGGEEDTVIGQELSTLGSLWGDLNPGDGPTARAFWSGIDFTGFGVGTKTAPNKVTAYTDDNTWSRAYCTDNLVPWPLSVAVGEGVIAVLTADDLYVMKWDEEAATWKEFARARSNPGCTAISFGNAAPGKEPSGHLLVGARETEGKMVVCQVVGTY